MNRQKTRKFKKAIAEIVHQIPKIIKHFFPAFKKGLSKIDDIRKRSHYEISEIIMGAISIFLFKEGSRNTLNNDRENDEFVRKHEILGMKLPHMDTVDDLFRVISPGKNWKNFKNGMIENLIENEGFNEQKNGSYELGHEYSEVSLTAAKNYYQSL